MVRCPQGVGCSMCTLENIRYFLAWFNKRKKIYRENKERRSKSVEIFQFREFRQFHSCFISSLTVSGC